MIIVIVVTCFTITIIKNIHKLKSSSAIEVTATATGEYLDLFKKENLSSLNVLVTYNNKNNYPH